MPFENDVPEGVLANRPLPPELKALFDAPEMREWNADQVHIWFEGWRATVREKAAAFRKYGVDVEKLIAHLNPMMEAVEKSAREADEATEKELQAEADCGDANYELFKHMDYMLKKMLETKPFDPFVEDWKELVDEWRKHMPKE